jgi:hypothetical protein
VTIDLKVSLIKDRLNQNFFALSCKSYLKSDYTWATDCVCRSENFVPIDKNLASVLSLSKD